jgi:hypothetical protein
VKRDPWTVMASFAIGFKVQGCRFNVRRAERNSPEAFQNLPQASGPASTRTLEVCGTARKSLYFKNARLDSIIGSGTRAFSTGEFD